MTAFWSQVTWQVARAGGLAAYTLLTLAVVAGLFVSLKWHRPSWWPRLVNYELHRHLTLLSLVFTSVHVLAVAVDPFTAFRWYEVLVPGLSHYRPLWMALGIVAAYLGLAVGLTSWLQRHIGYRAWRLVHFASFGVFALATVHGLGTGSDTRTPWAAALYASSAGLVSTLVAVRLFQNASVKLLSLLATVALGGALALGTLWAAKGPLRPGWNRTANNGHGSGGRGILAAAQASAPPAVNAFQASLSGPESLRQAGEELDIHIAAQLTRGAQGSVTVDLLGLPEDGGFALTGSRVVLHESAPVRGVYQGSIAAVRGPLLIAHLTPAAGGVPLDLALRLNAQGTTVSGTAVTLSSR